MTEVSNNAALGLVHFSYFGSTTIISFLLPYLIDKVGPMYLYSGCAVMTVVIVSIQFFFIKETAKLTDKEKKQLYCPPELKSKIQISDSMDHSIDTDASMSMSLRNFA